MKFLAISSLIALAQIPSLVSAKGGFYSTCIDIHIGRESTSNIELYLACKWKSGGYGPDMRYYLNHAVANDDGQLTLRRSGKFSSTCNGCSILVHSAVLRCNCKRKNGSWRLSTVDLNKEFTNIDSVAWAFDVASSPR